MNIEDLSGYGIVKTIAEIIEQGFAFDEETGEVLFEHEDLDKLEMALDDKMSSTVGYYNVLCDKVDNLKKRKKEIDYSIKLAEKRVERMKDYLDYLMKANNKTKFEKDEHKISYRKSVASNISDEKALRDYINSDKELTEKYLKFKEPDINKKAIMEDIKSSKKDNEYTLEIPGFELIENNNIIIK